MLSSLLAVSACTVHEFMNLTFNQVSFFIQQVGLSAASFGVSDADVTTVVQTLNNTFNMQCLPAAAVVTSDAELQSICINPTCPLAPNNNCTAYTTGNTAIAQAAAAVADPPATAASTPAPTALATQAPTPAPYYFPYD